MSVCPACNAAAPEGSRWCPACGARLSGSPLDITATSASGTPSQHGSDSGDPTRFIPGAVVDGRYRIVGLLGRGGMGEVYRADDLKLGQPVALKFLPDGLERDPQRLERFLNEVRTARKVSHANVCRVYDVGEVNGSHYLSMEYVDGEDLSSLLRRIGRLPGERAIEVARQICAALAAAHEQGILHRDLKPANVMIDGRGRVRLTDFGLAGLAESIGDDDVRSGTPGYMSPEQISGEGVSVRSDIYALGLVLYELFTGKAAFNADSIAQLRKLQTASHPSSPTSHVQNLDPAVEQVVLRCLAKDPNDRPPSVLAVSAALPGGDPLAAALAAGETPSPELVAEAGGTEPMKPAAALLLALACLALFVCVTRWAGTMSSLHYLQLEKRPEVLMDRAQGILDQLGFDDPVYREPFDWAWGLLTWSNVFEEVAAADDSPGRWEGLRERPDAASFWYRQSPTRIQPNANSNRGPVFTRGRVRLTDPLPLNPAEVVVILDLAGRLRRLEVVPKRMSTVEAEEPDWAPLFELAALDPARFTPDWPRYQRFFAPDHRRAWLGTRAEQPDVELRVDVGSFEGRPALFNVATSQSLESIAADPQSSRTNLVETLIDYLPPVLILLVLAYSVRLARRNLLHGRADRRGALRIALVFAGLFFATNGLDAHLLFTRVWAGEIWPLIAGAAFMGLAFWCMYIAAEPIGRQVWPTMFVSSSRLLSRQRVLWRDPLLGKSVLIGVIFGAIQFLVDGPVHRLIGGWLDGAPRQPLGFNTDALQGQRAALAELLNVGTDVGYWFVLVVTLVVIRLAVKRAWLAVPLAIVAWTLIDGAGSVEGFIVGAVIASLSMFVLLRWGILAMVVTQFVHMLAWFARTSDWSAWHAQAAVMALAIVIALTAYGVWAAIGPRRSLPATV